MELHITRTFPAHRRVLRDGVPALPSEQTTARRGFPKTNHRDPIGPSAGTGRHVRLAVLRRRAVCRSNPVRSVSSRVFPHCAGRGEAVLLVEGDAVDRKSTRLNSSHVAISYAVFCSNKKTNQN